MPFPESEITKTVENIHYQNGVCHRKIEVSWFHPKTEPAPKLPDKVIANACSHGAGQETVYGTIKEEVISRLAALGVSSAGIIETIIADLPTNSPVSIFGFLIGPNSPFVAVLERKLNSPSSEEPYRISLIRF